MTVVLSKTDQEFANRMGNMAILKMRRYRQLTGTGWQPYSYSLGYENAQAWYDALCKAVEEAEKKANAE